MDGTLCEHIELSPLTESQTNPIQEEDSWEVFSEEDSEEDIEQEHRNKILRYSIRE
jgi:hypothetical protein